MVEQLARHYPRSWIAARLARASLGASAGEPLFAALKRQGLLTAADAALLSAAERAGNLPWALRSVADNTERRLAYRLNGWLQVLFPLTILIVGSAVGFIVVAFFLPVINLTKGLS
jgi:type II secretory pathway component PulF